MRAEEDGGFETPVGRTKSFDLEEQHPTSKKLMRDGLHTEFLENSYKKPGTSATKITKNNTSKIPSVEAITFLSICMKLGYLCSYTRLKQNMLAQFIHLPLWK